MHLEMSEDWIGFRQGAGLLVLLETGRSRVLSGNEAGLPVGRVFNGGVRRSLLVAITPLV